MVSDIDIERNVPKPYLKTCCLGQGLTSLKVLPTGFSEGIKSKHSRKCAKTLSKNILLGPRSA
jgi:hypothetical protein